MNENEVIKRLGLKSLEELVEILESSDRKEIIQYLSKEDINLDFDKYIVVRFEEKESKITKKLQNAKSLTNHYKKGWACILKSENFGLNDEERPRTPTPKSFPKGNIPKGDKEWYFHRGHILAYGFGKNMKTYKHVKRKNKEFELISGNFREVNKKGKNIITQFSIANKAQADIEQMISDFLKNGIQEIYYEVKAIYRREGDVYPIGTEIFYLTLKGDSDKENISGHYFIPNTDVGFEIPDTAEESYQDFYTNGYSERYQEYFADSDRNEIELVEGLSSNGYILSLSDNGIFSAKSYDLNTKDETEIIDFKDIVDILEYPKSNIFFFCEDEIDSVDKFLKVKKIVRKSKKNKRYYPVEDNHSGIYLSYGINEGTDYDHCGRPTLKEAIKYKKQNSSKW
ncbi:TPA: hypothetical protein ACIRI2_001175 [Streptococcus suis]|nr:hypothetical protein [Streptococcus suis]HEL1676237.1 hypothetical protein [Streptococcus suis]